MRNCPILPTFIHQEFLIYFLLQQFQPFFEKLTSIKIYHFLLKPSFHITAALNGSEDITLAFDSLNVCCVGIRS